MFDGVPEQFHQFITSRTSQPIPLSPFSLLGSSSPAAPLPQQPHHSLFPTFQPYTPHQTVFQPLPQHLQQQYHHQLLRKDEKKHQNITNSLLECNLVQGQRERSIVLTEENSDLWFEDEVLTLLRIRSSMESWYPEFTWEHISRKLAEFGFKRSAEKCKEKFEEENRNFNTLSDNKNYKIYSELDDIYHEENPHVKSVDEKDQDLENQNEDVPIEEVKADESNSNTPMKNEAEKQQENIPKKRKRKYYNLKKMKPFCETLVSKIMAQQEELHNKLIEEILKRDQELVAKEEAWRNQESEKLNKEIEIIMAKQAIVNDRQPMLFEFLNKLTSDNDFSHKDQDFSKKIEDLLKIINNPSSSSALPPPGDAILPQNPNLTSIPSQKVANLSTSSSETHSPQNPSSIIQTTMVPNDNSSSTQSKNLDTMQASTNNTSTSSYNKSLSKGNDGTGNRWPKDEVLALINLRCSLNNISNNCHANKESGGVKCPLWERISKGMEKVGYKRSAKRCKEKWENINKYFRKTKDNKRKRPLDSRTCPYFHQLSKLYTQVGPAGDLPENSTCRSASPDVPNGQDELHADAAEAGKPALPNQQTSTL